MDINIRRLETHAVATPPSGTMALSVARHIEEAPSPDGMRLLHERRAKLIHSLVDELSLDVKVWGGTDAPQEKEIVDLVIAAATIVAAMITRPAKVPSASDGVLGVKLKRADGQELTFAYVRPRQGEAASIIKAFMLGQG